MPRTSPRSAAQARPTPLAIAADSRIDAPETGQDLEARAKQAASELAFGKDILVRPAETDRSLNRAMVEQGLAWWYREFAPQDRELARLEAEARASKRGLWGQAGAVPPWDWRRGRGVQVVAGVVGNRRSHVYHAPHCRSAAAMKAENRIEFPAAGDAEAKGYHRAGDCV